MERLKDEAVLLALAQKVSEYLQAQDELAKLAGVALKRIQHFYYKTGEVGRHPRVLWAPLVVVAHTSGPGSAGQSAIAPFVFAVQMWCTVRCAS